MQKIKKEAKLSKIRCKLNENQNHNFIYELIQNIKILFAFHEAKLIHFPHSWKFLIFFVN